MAKRIMTYTQKEIDNLPDRTDWKRVDRMKDEDIDCSDIPELDEEFWKNAKFVRPTKKSVGIRLDKDILEWFKSQGKGYQTHINSVLRHYVETMHRD